MQYGLHLDPDLKKAIVKKTFKWQSLKIGYLLTLGNYIGILGRLRIL